jgi:hypothetical protein
MSIPAREKLWNYFECLFAHQLSAESDKGVQPDWIRTPLLSHQLTSLRAALVLEQAKLGKDVAPVPGDDQGGRFFTQYGILGDRVGAGKSLVALAMLRHPPPPATQIEYVWRVTNPYVDNAMGLLREKPQTKGLYGNVLRQVRTTLFIIPHALMGQWEEYVKHDTTLKCVFIKKRKDATDETLSTKLEEYDAVFVSSTMWREFDITLNASAILWSRAFIDEADSIALSLAPDTLHARFYWLISASWMNLLYAGGVYVNTGVSYIPLPHTPSYVVERMGRYFNGDYLNIEGSRCHFVKRLCGNVSLSGYNTNILNAVLYQGTRILIHNTEDYIRNSFTIPDISHMYILCQTPPNIQILRSLISEDMMERLHAGDAEGVLEILGMKTRSPDEITAAVTESIQKDLDTTKRLLEFKREMEYSTESAKTKAIEHLEEKIARLQSRIDTIQSRLTNTSSESCPICFSDVVTPALTPCCRNLFCFACICEVLKRTHVCPLCRETIPSIQAMHVMGETNLSHECKPTTLLTKQEQFRTFLQNTPDARVLMFSGYDATFSGLSQMLESEAIPFATLQGSQARISRLIRDFGDGKYRVLFLNSRNMGAGLNIQAASHVVLYHRMNVETQNQIIGRAVRMGRTESLKVVHLLHGNEMTEEERACIEHV